MVNKRWTWSASDPGDEAQSDADRSSLRDKCLRGDLQKKALERKHKLDGDVPTVKSR